MLLPTTYLGPISWYRNLLTGEDVVIDIHEHYIKQTFRNRCSICGPNARPDDPFGRGKMELIVPVNAPNHTAMKDVRIDYSDGWQRKHWGAIRSAYGQSPFFNFYSDKFEKFYRDKSKIFLIDLNHELMEVILQILKEKIKVEFSNKFIPYGESDLRLPSSVFSVPEYQQVFSDRFPFIPDLSIIDLLFCTGPEAKSYLHSS
ncbi:MAG TPA: WbqC family protein [Bacteroidia bacterium]|jgi:hypothetical protein|nr:WbqC family protein [Bacteroidia bacterium]